ESDKPLVPYPSEFFARAVEAVMRDAGVNRAILVGHSLGGPIAWAFVRMYPSKVKAIVLVDATFSPSGPPSPNARVEKTRLQTYASRLADRARGLSGAAGTQQFAREIETMFSDRTSDELRQRIRKQMMATPEHTRVATVTSQSYLAYANYNHTF